LKEGILKKWLMPFREKFKGVGNMGNNSENENNWVVVRGQRRKI